MALGSKVVEGSTSCWVGVRGDESTTDAGEASEYAGERARRAWYSGTEAVSESRVISDEPLGLIFVLYVLELEFLEVRPPEGLEVFVRMGTAPGDLARGDFARTVLGWEPVVEVRSVIESCSLMLERDAVWRPVGVETRVELSTLRRPASISRCRASEVLRELLVLAVFRRSAVVVVRGGLGGARGGGGGARVGGGISFLFSSCEPSMSVRSGVMTAFLRSTLSLSRE